MKYFLDLNNVVVYKLLICCVYCWCVSKLIHVFIFVKSYDLRVIVKKVFSVITSDNSKKLPVWSCIYNQVVPAGVRYVIFFKVKYNINVFFVASVLKWSCYMLLNALIHCIAYLNKKSNCSLFLLLYDFLHYVGFFYYSIV